MSSAPAGRWRLGGFYLLFFAVAGVLMPFLPVYLEHRGLTVAEIGALLAAGTATKLLAPYLWAWCADRIGARMPLVRAGLTVSLLIFAALPQVPGEFAALAVLLALYQFCWNAVLPQFEAVTLTHLGARAAQYGRVRLWGSVGFVIAVFGAGALTSAYGIAALAPLVSALLLLLAAYAWLVPEPPRSEPEQRSSQISHSGRSDFMARLMSKRVLAFLGAALLMQASHGPYYAFFSLNLEQSGVSRMQVSVLWVLGVVAEIGLFAWAPRLLSAFPVSRLFVFCTLATAARWVLTAFAGDVLALLVVAQLGHAISFGLYHATSMHLLKAFFDERTLGRGQAVYSSVGFGLGGALGSGAGGLIWSYGGPLAGYLSAAAAAALAALLLLASGFARSPRGPHASAADSSGRADTL